MIITIQEEDEEKAQRLLRTDEAFSLLWDIDQACRSTLKYTPDFETHEKEIEYYQEKIEEVRTMIHENNILNLFQ